MDCTIGMTDQLSAVSLLLTGVKPGSRTEDPGTAVTHRYTEVISWLHTKLAYCSFMFNSSSLQSGSHTLEISETNCSIFALRSPKAIHLIPGEHGDILGILEVGWENVTCWSTRGNISETRKDRGKVSMDKRIKLRCTHIHKIDQNKTH